MIVPIRRNVIILIPFLRLIQSILLNKTLQFIIYRRKFN